MMKKKLVILTGAGISAESGIQTFRDLDGLWEGHNVEDVASIKGWNKNRELVLDFYNKRRKQLHSVVPNAGHFGLVDLEEHFDVTIITQNVDDLHERAGSKKVIHLHGELIKKRTVNSPGKLYNWGEEDINVGDKGEDNSQFRPHIVWFGEAVPMMYTADLIASDADIFVVIGTSLQVYPAANLLMSVTTKNNFLLDKKAPDVDLKDFTVILKSAVEGIEELKTELIKLA